MRPKQAQQASSVARDKSTTFDNRIQQTVDCQKGRSERQQALLKMLDDQSECAIVSSVRQHRNVAVSCSW